MFRETQEDFLRYLLFDDQEDDIDFFNSNNNGSLMNHSNMDGNLFNQNDTGLDPDNNPFSTNSVYNNNNNNNNKGIEFEKQEDEINQQMTEMTLNNSCLNEQGYNNTNPNLSQINNYSNSFSINNAPLDRGSFVGNAQDKYNDFEIRNGNKNQRFDDYAADPIANPYYESDKIINNPERPIIDGNISNHPLNQSLYLQPAPSNNNNNNNYNLSQPEYNSCQVPANKDSVEFDPRMGSPMQQNGNRYFQSPSAQQYNEMMSSPRQQQPVNGYSKEYQSNSAINNNNYYGEQQMINNGVQQMNGEQLFNGESLQNMNGRTNRDYCNIDQQRSSLQESNYYQAQSFDNTKNNANIYGAINNNYPQELYEGSKLQMEQRQNQEPIYYDNQNSQYPLQQQNIPTIQYYNNNNNNNNNDPSYKNTYQNSNHQAIPVIYSNPQTPFYSNIPTSFQEGGEQIKTPLIGEVPILAEMRKRKSTNKSQMNAPQSKKSSSIKEQQQHKYEKKYQKSQQSQKLQQQLSQAINQNQGGVQQCSKEMTSNQASSSATLQYYTNTESMNANTESVNASQYSSTDNNMSALTTEINNNTISPYSNAPITQNNTNQNLQSFPQNNQQLNLNSQQQQQVIHNGINGSNRNFQQSFNSYQNNNNQQHHQHHCCDGNDEEEDDSDHEDEIQNEDLENNQNFRGINHNNHKHSSQLNDSNSNDSKGEKEHFSDQDPTNSEKNSKADEIAILAESIKHCNKKNVVKNIMSAFLTFMNDRKNKIYTQQEQECIPTLYYSTQSVGIGEDEDQIEEIRKKFKRYISQKSLNHYTVRLLILHPNYGPLFKHYLTNPIKKWINNSKVADLGAHIKMIGFFLACFQDNQVLEELKRHEKKRAHFS